MPRALHQFIVYFRDADAVGNQIAAIHRIAEGLGISSCVYYEHFAGDKEIMGLAEQWVLRSVSIADLYKGNNLLASISFVLGKKDQALKAANHAIELAKQYKNDYSQTTQLLNVIQKMP